MDSMSPGELIKERLSIVDVVSQYLKLERAGKNFKARCPFHAEKTGSFFVSPDRGSYHCFGCQRGGDIFTFVQEMEGYDFPTALSTLAEQAGVQIKPEREGERSQRGRLLSLLEEAALYYQRILLTSDEAKNYLKERGLVEETVRRFRLGYAPREWESLLTYAKTKGYTPEELEGAGLVIARDTGARHVLSRGYYDRFRGRIMFPIFNTNGSVIGFSGRILPGLPEDPENPPAKYINTPETVLYHKSRALYGFSHAKQAMRTQNTCVLVEGQMDVVLSHQSGVLETVAVSGTALTLEHIQSIKRLSDRIIMAFDADSAGLRAGERSVHLALEAGLDVSIAPIPNGKDPADLVREKPSLWHDVLQGATHVVDFYITVLSETVSDERLRGRALREKVLPLIARLESDMEKAHFMSKIAANLHITEEALWAELRKISRGESTATSSDVIETPLSRTAKDMVRMRLAGILLAYGDAPESRDALSIVRARAQEILGADLLGGLSDQERRTAALEAEALYGGSGSLLLDAESLLKSLTEYLLKEQFVIAMDMLKKAELAGDESAATAALKECQRLTARLNELK